MWKGWMTRDSLTYMCSIGGRSTTEVEMKDFCDNIVTKKIWCITEAILRHLWLPKMGPVEGKGIHCTNSCGRFVCVHTIDVANFAKKKGRVRLKITIMQASINSL